MCKNKLTVFLIFLFFLNETWLSSIYAEAKLKDPVAELLKKMEQATNTEKIKDIKVVSFKISMNITAMNISGVSEITATKDKAYMKISMAGMEQEMGFDGKKSWSKDITQGLRETSGQERETIIQATIDVWKDPKSYYTEITAGSDEMFQGKDCFVLIFKKEGISDKTIYIEKANHLVLGTSEIQDTPQGKMTVKSIMNSYKKCENGYLMADKITQDMGIMKMELTLSDIKFDPKVDEKIFNQPEE